MDLVANSKWHPRLKERGRPKETRALPWQWHVAFALLLAFPFGVLAYEAHRLLFMSNLHAHLAAKALLALDRGRLELIGFTYPPLPFVITAFWPTPVTPALAASLAAGAIAWLLWRHLSHTGLPFWARLVVLGGAALFPESLFLATQSLNETATLLFFLLAWYSFLAFTRSGMTWGGFVAGLILAVAFYFNAYAFVYALFYAISAPFFSRTIWQEAPRRRLAAAATAVVVVGFPAIAAFAGWSYVSWVFTGNPWSFAVDPNSPLFPFFQPAAEPVSSFQQALLSTVQDISRLPVYIAIGLIVFYYTPRRSFAYLVPAIVITLIRAMGMFYSVPFALGTYLVVALAAIPRRTSPRWGWVLLVAVVLQSAIGLDTRTRGEFSFTEFRAWQQVVFTGVPRQEDRFELEIGRQLREAPPRRVLADDRSAYRLIARTGTARPFLLPPDPEFLLALSAPEAYVDYILLPTDSVPGVDLVADRYGKQPPQGFVVDATWPGWVLYRHQTAPSLFLNLPLLPEH